MKRKGRQHGMVRTYPILPSAWNPRPESRTINKLGSPPTAGLFTKVSPKPTNHSKFTGKCGRPRCNDCHVHPASKSKDKAKGTHKLRLVTSQVPDVPAGLKFYGVSATDVLDHLASLDHNEEVDNCSEYYDGDDDLSDVLYDQKTALNEVGTREVDDKNIIIVADDEDDKMSYYDVGYVLESVDGGEEWCLLEEM